mgnify:CR=1 FL=1|jgi:hypothetical protein
MISFSIACALAAAYAGCYAVHAYKRHRYGALCGAALLVLCMLACGLACLIS